jgi:carbon-monoxide dehydrogenase medium subunit
MKPAPFEYIVVDSAAQAVEGLGRFDGDARCLAGGQSLVPLLNMRLMRPAAVVDINRVPGLDGIAVGDGVVRIGALVRYSTLERSALIQERLPLLARAVPFVGDRQIRNRGTLGGALCHADPAGEMALTAVTLGGSISVVSPAGCREIAVEDFFLGPYTTALGPADLLTGVSLPDGAGTAAVVVEHARRHGDFAVVSVAATGRVGPDGTWASVRIGLGGVADRPRVAARASALLAGTRLEPEAVRAAGDAALEVVDPGSDIRASAEYRRHLVPIFMERALETLRAQVQTGAKA